MTCFMQVFMNMDFLTYGWNSTMNRTIKKDTKFSTEIDYYDGLL